MHLVPFATRSTETALPLLIALSLTGWACSQSAARLTQDHAAATAQSGAAAQPIYHDSTGALLVAPEDTLTPVAPMRPYSVAAEQARFLLPPGYRIEPVLSEPAIKEPAAIAFDGNGRMFVLELRSYMQDADAAGELTPVSRISMHEDKDNDGLYETHHVFVDSLVFPRFVMPFGVNSILSMESNEDDVFQFTDTDGDGKADRKTLFTTNYGRSGNVEHQQAFLYRGLDNWLYSTYNAFRVRWTPGGILREPTGQNRAQWGVTQDNDGKIWFQGGASGLPSYFQFPIVYGNYDIEAPFEEGFEVPYGVAGVGDYQPGPRFSREDGTLNRVTGSAGSDVYRGHRLPEDLIGHYLYGEPVARIVRRIEPVVSEGLTTLRNVYQSERSEFIRSTDPLFRPVDMATAPDGSLYIVDMYRGIIQQGTWTPRGSFLRAKIEQYAIDEIVGHGRIWRVTYDGMDRDRRQPRMLDETPAQWVRHLEHPNGWWRDTAQQLLVLKQDRSIFPRLEAMVRSSDNRLARYHALWTLEGLSTLNPNLVRELMRDPEPGMRIQAIRASETLYKAGDLSLATEYRTLAQDPNVDVAIQALMTLDVLEDPNTEEAVRQAMAAHTAQGVQFVGNQILNPPQARSFGGNRLSEAETALLAQGASIYGELCAQCHGPTGLGTPLGDGQFMAPALSNSSRVQGHRDYVIKTLLHGLAGPVESRSYPGDLMVGMGQNPDAWIAAVASFIRTNLSNDASLVTPDDVTRVRAATAERTTPYTFAELTGSVPALLRYDKSTWKASASHTGSDRIGGTDAAEGALTFEGWTTGAPQEPGMWFQVALPAPVTLAQLQFQSPLQRRGRGPDAPPPLTTSPHAYQVQVSMDGATWSAPVAQGQGERFSTTIDFEPVQARFVRITQTAEPEDEAPWSMLGLKLFGLSNP